MLVKCVIHLPSLGLMLGEALCSSLLRVRSGCMGRGHRKERHRQNLDWSYIEGPQQKSSRCCRSRQSCVRSVGRTEDGPLYMATTCLSLCFRHSQPHSSLVQIGLVMKEWDNSEKLRIIQNFSLSQGLKSLFLLPSVCLCVPDEYSSFWDRVQGNSDTDNTEVPLIL